MTLGAAAWLHDAVKKILRMPVCECDHPAVQHWHGGRDGLALGFKNIGNCALCKECLKYKAFVVTRGW